MRPYGQYCPIARGAEIFAERWTPVIVRNLHIGATTFGEILDGAPGLSRTLLSRRLAQLERVGLVDAKPKATGRGFTYHLTEAGLELWEVCDALGEWGAKWLEFAPQHLDPGVTLWSMCRQLDPDRLPPQRVLVEFDFTDASPRRFWILVRDREGEVCREHPGGDVDLWVAATARAFTRWHIGHLSWVEGTVSGDISIQGPAPLVRAFPTWNRGSPYRRIAPADHKLSLYS